VKVRWKAVVSALSCTYLVSAPSRLDATMKLQIKLQRHPRGRTSLKSIVPSSPRADTTSRPISLAMYSCVKDMSAERNMVSFGGAMVATQETSLPVKMAGLERW
jgi:hypothetical protein